MPTSKNQGVRAFLKELKAHDTEKSEIVEQVRKLVFAQYPKVSERIMYGGIMFTLEKDFGGVFANKHHVSFEFSDGYRFKDPQKLLEGTGKFRRHLKLKSRDDIEGKQVTYFIKQAI